MAKKSKKEHIDKIIRDLQDDRDSASALLRDASSMILNSTSAKKEELYKDVGPVTGKYIEVLQKINDQYIKLIATMKSDLKDEEGDDEIQDILPSDESIDKSAFSKKALSSIYDIIENDKKN